MSGKAIQMGSMQSNAASMPYMMGYIKGLNRLAAIVVDLIPKYYITPRSLPVREKNGSRDYVMINDKNNQESVDMSYDPRSLQVKVEAGVNSAMQKNLALEQIIRLMSVSESFSAFINSEGLETLLDNVDIRGADQLKSSAIQFMQELKQKQAQAAEGQDPAEKVIAAEVHIETAKVQQKDKQLQADMLIDTEKLRQEQIKLESNMAIANAKIAVQEQEAYTRFLQVLNDSENKQALRAIEEQRLNTETVRDAIELSMDYSESMGAREQPEMVIEESEDTFNID
jgi:hypothetical protein